MTKILRAALLWLALASPAAAQFADQMTWGGTAAGTANAPTVSIANWTANLAGVPLRFVVASSNTGAATLNVSGLGAVGLKKMTAAGLADLAGAELVAGELATVVYNGTNFVLSPTGQPITLGRILQISATGTYTPMANLVYAKVTLCGGGGGGSGIPAPAGGQVAIGGGGGGGGKAIKRVAAADIGASQTVTIGAGGAFGASGAGGAGGTTTFGGIFSATGGSGGSPGPAGTSSAAAGTTGGVGTGGDANFPGNVSGSGFAASGITIGYSGYGAPGCFGGGAVATVTSTAANGTAGVGCGSGGSSGAGSNGSSANGGAGAAGCAIIEDYVQ